MSNQKDKNEKIERGNVYLVDLNPIIGSEQGGKRPAVVIQNDIGNIFSPTTIIAPLTRCKRENTLPTHVETNEDKSKIESTTILLEQIRTIDKRRIIKYLGKVDATELENINKAIKISLCLD